MPVYPAVRAQVVMPYFASTEPRDVTINTFHFALAGSTPEQVRTAWQPHLEALYFTAAPTTGDGIVDYLSPGVRAEDAYINWYDLTQPEPRQPIKLNMAGAVVPSTPNSLPYEVAACLSYGSLGTPPARHRGRIYIGPLNENTLSSGEFGRFSETFVLTLAEVASRFLSNNPGLGGSALGDWSVLSRAGNVLNAITGGQVDLEPDTQRRRQRRPIDRRAAYDDTGAAMIN